MSPSGLWKLDTNNVAQYLPDQFPDRPINISTFGQITFLGQISPNLIPNPSPESYVMRTQFYNDFCPRQFRYSLLSLGEMGGSPIPRLIGEA